MLLAHTTLVTKITTTNTFNIIATLIHINANKRTKK